MTQVEQACLILAFDVPRCVVHWEIESNKISPPPTTAQRTRYTGHWKDFLLEQGFAATPQCSSPTSTLIYVWKSSHRLFAIAFVLPTSTPVASLRYPLSRAMLPRLLNLLGQLQFFLLMLCQLRIAQCLWCHFRVCSSI